MFITGRLLHTLCVFDDPRLLALHDGDGGIGGTQIDTNDLALDLVVCISSPQRRPCRSFEGR